MKESCITTCIKCRNYFEYDRAAVNIVRNVCDDCRRITINGHKKRWRGKKKPSENFSRHDLDSGLLKSSHDEIAAALNLNERSVREIERRALFKIRNNPQLKKLFDIWKEEGTPVAEGLIGATDAGRLLLDYQLAVVDWWSVYEKISAERSCTLEALECLGGIERFQKKIVETLEKI